jgi:hypothetical protein
MHEFISQYPNIKARFDHVVPVFSCMNNTKPCVVAGAPLLWHS